MLKRDFSVTRIMESILFGDWKMVVFLALVAIVSFYFYFTSNMDYWEKRGFPQAPRSMLSDTVEFLRVIAGQNNGNDVIERLYKEAGDRPFIGFYEKTRPILLVKGPDLLKNILIKDFHAFTDRGFELDEEIDPLDAKGLSNLKGERWKNMRARLSPTFTSGRMKAMFPLMQTCSEDLLKCILKVVQSNAGEATIDIQDYLGCFSIDVIATCAFGIQCDALQNPEASEFRRMGRLTFQFTWKRNLLFTLMFIAPKLLKILGLKFTMDESYVFFRNFVQEIMRKREEAIDKGEGSGYGDFIHQLVLLKKRGMKVDEMKNDDKEEENQFLRSDGIETDVSWANVDLDDLAAQAMLFFSAGFETTSSLLSFAMYELSSSENGKQIQRRVAEEVARVMKEDGGRITYDGLTRMHLLDRVLNETLRLHPPAGVTSRLTVEDYQIPGTNLKIEKDVLIFIPIAAMHRDEKFFPNPTQFDPDRFLPKDQRNHFTFIPFGEGPRLCIGQRFAMMQARLALAALVSKFEFNLCLEKTPVPLKYSKKAFILAPQSVIWLKTKLRHKRE